MDWSGLRGVFMGLGFGIVFWAAILGIALLFLGCATPNYNACGYSNKGWAKWECWQGNDPNPGKSYPKGGLR